MQSQRDLIKKCVAATDGGKLPFQQLITEPYATSLAVFPDLQNRKDQKKKKLVQIKKKIKELQIALFGLYDYNQFLSENNFILIFFIGIALVTLDSTATRKHIISMERKVSLALLPI